ncbi:hypothetical protein D5086_026201 [Populus alba]|uniref:Uncharacterized protein n=1 Tax=Populus alba TaxID=43335 RepID=A0ACC4B1N7_POPAL
MMAFMNGDEIDVLQSQGFFKDGRYGDGMDLSGRRAALMMMKLTVCAYRWLAIYKRNLVCTFLSKNTRATEHRNGGGS